MRLLERNWIRTQLWTSTMELFGVAGFATRLSLSVCLFRNPSNRIDLHDDCSEESQFMVLSGIKEQRHHKARL